MSLNKSTKDVKYLFFINYLRGGSGMINREIAIEKNIKKKN